MMDKETLLDHCLDELAKGEPMHEILARYPQEAATLQPILVVAESLFNLAVDPTNEARIASRRAFLRQAAMYRPRPAFWQRFALLAASVVLLLLFAGSGLAWAADAALPGEPLYVVKRSLEQAQLTLSGNSEQLKMSFAARRRYEVTVLLERSREAEVEFHGTLELMSAERWVISGIPVMISDTTRIQGQPSPGAVVLVHGRTINGVVQAAVISVVGPAEPPNNAGESTHVTEPTPPVTVTSLPSATALPPTPTATPAAKPGRHGNGDDSGPHLTSTAERGGYGNGGVGGPNATPTVERGGRGDGGPNATPTVERGGRGDGGPNATPTAERGGRGDGGPNATPTAERGGRGDSGPNATPAPAPGGHGNGGGNDSPNATPTAESGRNDGGGSNGSPTAEPGRRDNGGGGSPDATPVPAPGGHGNGGGDGSTDTSPTAEPGGHGSGSPDATPAPAPGGHGNGGGDGGTDVTPTAEPGGHGNGGGDGGPDVTPTAERGRRSNRTND